MHLGGGLSASASREGPGDGSPATGRGGRDRRRPPPGARPVRSGTAAGGAGGRNQETFDAAAEQLVRMMDERGIERSLVVIVPPKRPGGAAGPSDRDFVRAAVRRHPGRLYLMDGGETLKSIMEATPAASVTPEVRADFERRAEAVLDAGAAGFGEMISLHFCLGPTHSYQWTPADHPLFLALADVAARRNVPIDIHMEAVPGEIPCPENLRQACGQNPAQLPASIPALERLLSHNRNARIVWQHIGWDNYGGMTVEFLRRMLAQHPNLFLSLRVERRTTQVGAPPGAGAPMPNRIVDADGRIKAEWIALLRDFPDRFVIGSDEFVGSSGGLTTQGHASFDETWEMFSQIPPDVAARIGRENAIRIYGLR